MSIVVTAATGQLGSLVIDELLERVPASEVVAVVRNAEKGADIAARGVELRIADYSDPESLAKAFGPAMSSSSSPATSSAGATQHTAVINAAKEAGAARLAYTGVWAVRTPTSHSPPSTSSPSRPSSTPA